MDSFKKLNINNLTFSTMVSTWQDGGAQSGTGDGLGWTLSWLYRLLSTTLALILPHFLASLLWEYGRKRGSVPSQPAKTVSWADESQVNGAVLAKTAREDIECPYEYILRVYGRSHFAKIVNIIDSTVKDRDPELYGLILEVMDAVHFGAILVDDVADNSILRKAKPAAHRIYGSSETINRAYLRILEVTDRCREKRPALIPFILQNLTEIHKGQDISLVWRRDGLPTFSSQKEALDAYRHCAHLKTGGLFRLVGQLITGGHEKDDLMSKVGWYCHLQNDCKNLYSADVLSAKGTLAEDLENGEYSFPIVLALYGPAAARIVVETALRSARESSGSTHREEQLVAALHVLRSEEVRKACLVELQSLQKEVSQFAALWGRTEKMNL